MVYNNVPNGSRCYNADWLSISTHGHTGAARDGQSLHISGCFAVSGALHDHSGVGSGGTTLGPNCSITGSPTISNFTNATHTHGGAGQGGSIIISPFISGNAAITGSFTGTTNLQNVIIGSITNNPVFTGSPHIDNFANAVHTHATDAQGGTLGSSFLRQDVIAQTLYYDCGVVAFSVNAGAGATLSIKTNKVFTNNWGIVQLTPYCSATQNGGLVVQATNINLLSAGSIYGWIYNNTAYTATGSVLWSVMGY
jgi:hypothetical protein